MDKRKSEQVQVIDAKKLKTNQVAVPSLASNSQLQRHRVPQRSSALAAPIILLTGHEASVLSCCFSRDGNTVASSDANGEIFLWNTFGKNENYGLIKLKSSPITQIKWSKESSHLYASCHDKLSYLFDASSGQRVQKFQGHLSIVNGLSVSCRSDELLASVSDDATCRIWDRRSKYSTSTINHNFPLLSVDWAKDSLSVFTAGVGNSITCWDTRNSTLPLYTLKGHTDTVTGLCVSPDATSLLSTAMDNSVKTWDIKPFTSKETRLLNTFMGAPHGHEKNIIRPAWSSDSRFIVSGSADRTVVVWSVASQRILYKLPGHKGGVNQVDWHPKDPIILSGSVDKMLFMGELSTNVLQ